MVRCNIHEAKTQLSRLLVRVAGGEEVVISRDGKPIARLVPYTAPPADRHLGIDRGRVWIADDFDETPEEVLREFEA